MKISIIVPVYKVEAYLPACIESILGQTFRDFELILVDDGSPDKCGKICDQYAAGDERVKVIHKENAGVAMARNSGLDIAKGEWISFVDGDDWLSQDAFEKLLVPCGDDEIDCVVGACTMVIQTGKEERTEEPKGVENRVLSGEEAVKKTLIGGSAAWNRLFRRNIFEELRFPKNRTNDDEYVALRAYALCRKVVYISDATYFYRIRPNSITTATVSYRTLDMVKNARENIEFVRGRYPELTECSEGRYYKTLIYVSYLASRAGKSEEVRKIRKELHAELSGEKGKAWRNPYVPLKHKLISVFL